MILEVAQLEISEGREAEFERAFAAAEPIITAARGYISHQLQRCIEQPSRYILLVKWRTLEDHTEGFRGSTDYQRWKQLLHHFYDPLPEVLHFQAPS